MDIKTILEKLGYELTPDKDGWRSTRLYANGDNSTALKIYSDGGWTDFVDNRSGKFEELVAITLGNKPIDDAKEYLKNNDFESVTPSKKIEEPIMTKQKILDNSFLDKLNPDHSYWIKRGISLEVLKELRGGIYKGRYYFPVFEGGKIIGLSSRDLTGKSPSKYKINGEKKNFLYPIFCCDKEIKESKRAILVEGVPNAATLMTCGIRTPIVLFGVDVSFTVINYLLKISGVKIIISTDNDFAGRTGADKAYSKLRKYFDYDQIEIRILDKTNDLNDYLISGGAEAVRNFYV